MQNHYTYYHIIQIDKQKNNVILIKANICLMKNFSIEVKVS